MSLFSDRLKALREDYGLSLQELADKCGVSKSAIHLYEMDKRKPKREALEEMCCLFNVDMDYLLGKSDIKNAAANQLGYNSLYEAWKDGQSLTSPGSYVDAVMKKMPPAEPQLTEGDEKLLKLIRLMPEEMKKQYTELLESTLRALGLIQ